MNATFEIFIGQLLGKCSIAQILGRYLQIFLSVRVISEISNQINILLQKWHIPSYSEFPNTTQKYLDYKDTAKFDSTLRNLKLRRLLSRNNKKNMSILMPKHFCLSHACGGQHHGYVRTCDRGAAEGAVQRPEAKLEHQPDRRPETRRAPGAEGRPLSNISTSIKMCQLFIWRAPIQN